MLKDVSSAKRHKLPIFTAVGISFTNKRKSIGPRTEPCGTPVSRQLLRLVKETFCTRNFQSCSLLVHWDLVDTDEVSSVHVRSSTDL
ncbi:hypothetical protein J6590_086885 [Homalodisca vitripennis]|nr:hypothetical protein J6590_086885 [Homalodisca vitripennis]